MISPYLTIAEAAEFLRMSPGTVRQKMCAGEFREGAHYFKRPGTAPKFKRTALEVWVECKDRAPAQTGLRMAGGYILGSGPDRK